jgi:hypothetical protein
MTDARLWTVYRQDDNGNRFVVSSFESEEAAKEHAAELESHGHKQLYWVSRNDDQPTEQKKSQQEDTSPGKPHRSRAD